MASLEEIINKKQQNLDTEKKLFDNENLFAKITGNKNIVKNIVTQQFVNRLNKKLKQALLTHAVEDEYEIKLNTHHIGISSREQSYDKFNFVLDIDSCNFDIDDDIINQNRHSDSGDVAYYYIVQLEKREFVNQFQREIANSFEDQLNMELKALGVGRDLDDLIVKRFVVTNFNTDSSFGESCSTNVSFDLSIVFELPIYEKLINEEKLILIDYCGDVQSINLSRWRDISLIDFELEIDKYEMFKKRVREFDDWGK